MLEVELLELMHPVWAGSLALLKPSRWMPQALIETLNAIRYDRAILALPDRRYFETTLVPTLARTGARDVLFVGTRSYTAHYPGLFEDAGMRLWTTDIDPFAARYGAPERHVTVDATQLAPQTFGRTFDAVIFSGVIGFGLNSDVQVGRAATALSSLLNPGGTLVLGWNTDRSGDPLGNLAWQRHFRRSTVPGTDARVRFEGATHVFDYLEPNRGG